MKKKKIKKMIMELTDKFERELDVEVDVLNEKIRSTKETVTHIDERTMALDNVKLNNWVNHTKQLEDKIKILMDRTTVDYTKRVSAQEITYQECVALLECMKDRGATKEEINDIKKLMNKYIFRCKLFLINEEVPTPEEIIDGKKEE